MRLLPMGKHLDDRHHQSGTHRARVEAVEAWALGITRRPVDDETDCEKTIPIMIVLNEPPADWIPPDAPAVRRTGRAVQR